MMSLLISLTTSFFVTVYKFKTVYTSFQVQFAECIRSYSYSLLSKLCVNGSVSGSRAVHAIRVLQLSKINLYKLENLYYCNIRFFADSFNLKVK